MKKQKLILPISIIFLSIVLGIIYLNYEINQQRIRNNQAIMNAKDRLIELTIVREKIYWRCFSEKNKEVINSWKQSDEYKKALEEKPPYEENVRSGIDFNKYLSTLWRPERPVQKHNEIASKFCSEKADNTQAGLLIKKFRNKVPIEIITDNELRDIALENRY